MVNSIFILTQELQSYAQGNSDFHARAELWLELLELRKRILLVKTSAPPSIPKPGQPPGFVFYPGMFVALGSVRPCLWRYDYRTK